MPGLIHRFAIAFVRKFPLPDPFKIALENNIVVRQDPTAKQLRKFGISKEIFRDQPIYNFGTPENGQPILYFCHGGGFVTGLFKEYYDAMGRLQKSLDLPVICADYPMPPETDAQGLLSFNLACFREVRKRFPDSPIIIGGDSAGGHMTLTLAQALKPKEQKAVSAIFPLFAVVDMRREDDGLAYHKEEVLLHKENMEGVRRRFVGEFDKANPIISPIMGSFDNLPPVHIYSADKDPLYQDSLDLAAKCVESDQDHTHHIFKGYGHDFILFFPTPDAKRGLKRVTDHMRESLGL